MLIGRYPNVVEFVVRSGEMPLIVVSWYMNRLEDDNQVARTR